jgi:hypothetical protein
MPEIARVRRSAGTMSLTRNVASRRVSCPIGRSALEIWMTLYNTVQKNSESWQSFR